VHPTGGSRRVFRRFSWLEVGPGKRALSRPTHPRVTQSVGLPIRYQMGEIMLTLKQAIEKLRQNNPRLRSTFGIVEMSIFGSVARRQNKPSSDIDILISFESTPSIFVLERVRRSLREILQVRIDIVVDNNELDQNFRKHISNEKVKV